MAETLLSFGVQKICDLLNKESERFQGVHEQIDELKRDLKDLESFMKDVDAKKHISSEVRYFEEDMNEIVLDTEDIIETFLLKEELRKTSGIKTRMRRLSRIIVDRKKIASHMGGINKRISKVILEMKSFGVQQTISCSHALNERYESMVSRSREMPRNYEDILLGLEDNVKILVGYLVEDNYPVVSICGLRGLGKSTLAQQAFNHEMVKNHFDRAAWVCLSQQFTRKYVWQTILQKLSSKHDEQRFTYMTEEELHRELFQLLETSSTSLIVLDDLRKEEDWDRIKLVFPSEKGYKILLTSRNKGVGIHIDPRCVYLMPCLLSTSDSWTLFRRIAFPCIDRTVDEAIEEVGRRMIKCCGGLPLAIKVLGGLLATQHTIHDWERIYNVIASHLLSGTDTFDSILHLSVEELPVYMKQCFLYLAHFPEDFAISVKTLSYYLEAEGIPRPMYNLGATTEEVTYGYIEELVKRNMVISKRDVSTSSFETCHLHDMMREVFLRKADKENFLHILDPSHVTSTSTSQSHCKSRRLVIYSSDDTSRHMEGYIPNPRLRSLLFIKQSALLNWKEVGLRIKKLKLVRILDLSYVKFEEGKLPYDIGKLIHLRYLSLYLAKVSHVPSSLRNLRKLLYLNLCVDAEYPIYMPNFLKKMRELIYLYLPDCMQDKTKLELGNLTNLETLENFSTKHSSVRDLHGMKRLTTLSILLNGEGCTPEILSALRELGHLESLTMSNHKSDKKETVLDCAHGKNLKLTQVEQHFPSNLTTISLRHCSFMDDPMPTLEKLLHLKEVCLGERSFCGRRMLCSAGGFPQLQKLILKKLLQLEEWTIEEGSMQHLHTLSIHYCDRLKEVPDGLRFITSLKDLTIIIQEREFKKKLSKGGEDYYKVQHIPFLKVYGYIKI